MRDLFNYRMAANPKNIAEMVRFTVDSVTYIQCTVGASGAAIEFILAVITALDMKNASDIVQNDEKCKSLMEGELKSWSFPSCAFEMVTSGRFSWPSNVPSCLNL